MGSAGVVAYFVCCASHAPSLVMTWILRVICHCQNTIAL